jgi:hypothetical protein
MAFFIHPEDCGREGHCTKGIEAMIETEDMADFMEGFL